MHSIDAVNYPGVQLSWERVLAIAQNTPDPAVVIDDDEDNKDEDNSSMINHSPTRMQCMGRALQNMYTITSQDEGYTAFILTMVQELKYDCPVSMTFVKHIIDFSEIPSKTTIYNTTKAIISNETVNDMEKINQSIMWSILARKFAGNLAEAMWQDHIATILINSLADNNTNRIVKIFALLALESFSLTGSIKKRILNNRSLCILSALNKNLEECQTRLSDYNQYQSYHVQQQQQSSPPLSNLTNSPNLTLVSTQRQKYTGKRFYHGLINKCKSIKLKKKKKRDDMMLSNPALIGDDDLPTTIIPISKNELDDWSGLMQLRRCLKWSLDHIFDKSFLPSSVVTPRVHLNPKDCTSHCKLSANCLEIRNDTFFLESARATASVENGTWYYEALLLTNGVIQIGWGTSKCSFLPEEGCGVGDDPNGFAFDTYRSAVWAASEVIYPQGQHKAGRCKIGDVLGTLLDMDRGLCTFFINGQDLGLSVQFHTNIKKQMLGLFPIISLTSHQHVIVNFGDRPWLYSPLILSDYQPMCNSSTDSDILKKEKNEGEYDWDGPLCTLCFSEPKDTTLLPCQHNGFGNKCTKVLDRCPLCRTKIDERVYACKS